MSSLEAGLAKTHPSIRRLTNLLAGLALVSSLAVSVIVLVHGFRLLPWSYETSRPEVFVLEGVRRVAEGRELYRPLGSLPFVVPVYNPLTYWVPGVVSAWLNADHQGMLLVGRSLSYVASILLAGVLAGIVWRLTRSRRAALLTSFLPFPFHSVALTDFFRLRPESPASLLTLLGVGLVIHGRRGSLAAAAVAMFLAFAFKQSFIAAPVATLTYLLASRRWAAAFEFAALMAGLLGIFFATMAMSTRGAYFQDTFTALACNDVRPAQQVPAHAHFIWVRAWALALAALIAAFVLARDRRARFLMVYLGVTAIWTCWSAGKHGANINYWGEFALLSILITGLAVGLDTSGRWERLALLALVTAFAGQCLADPSPRGLWMDSLSFEALDRYVERFRAHDGPWLITNERVAARVGQPEVLDWYLLDILVEKGVLDPEPLLVRIRTGHYGLVAVGPNTNTRLEARVLEEVRAGPYGRIWDREPWNRMFVFERLGVQGGSSPAPGDTR